MTLDWCALPNAIARYGRVLIAAACWLPCDSGAQTTADELDPVATVDELPTVIVTSRHSQERALDVPISLVTLSGDDLAAAGLSSVTDLPQRVPGLTVVSVNPRLTTFSIRGLGSSSQNDGIESSVGLFVDGIYAGRAGNSVFDLIDLERIEVLRGPQGTLYGKNTTAGAIHVVTRLPTQSFEVQGESRLSEYGGEQFRGTVSGPLVDDELAARLTGYSTRRDGLIENRFDGQTLNNRDKVGARGQLLWTPPGQELVARLITEYGRGDESCCAYPLLAPIRPSVTVRDDYMEYTRASSDPFDREADSDLPTRAFVELSAASLELVLPLGSQQTLTSLSGWRDWQSVPLSDDGTSLRLAAFGTANGQQQFSQELRLNRDDGAFKSVAGLYYLHQQLEGRDRAVLGDELVQWTLGGLIRERVPGATRRDVGLALDLLIPPRTLDGMVVQAPYWQHTDSVAGFASTHWQALDSLIVDLGLRYTHEWKLANVSRSRSGGDVDASPLALTNNLDVLGNLIGVDLSGATFNGLIDGLVGGDFSRRDRYSEGNVSGNVALNYTLTPHASVYGSVARGYKSGGINLGVTGETVKPTFKPETVNAYELGAKADLLQRRLSLSGALYYSQVRNYQALTFNEDKALIPDPRQTNLLNVGRVRLRGVELQADALLPADLRLRAALAYNDAVTVDFRNAPDEDTRRNDRDLSGRQLYNAPRWSGNVGLSHSLSLGHSLVLESGVDTSYRSDTFGSVERGRSSRIEGYTLTDLRVDVRSERQGWVVGAWVRNVFDEQYLAATQALYGVGDYGGFAGDPRIIGLRFGWTLP